MQKTAPAASPAAYVAALDGWQKGLVTRLRSLVRSAGTLEELIKWRHLVYLAEGPVLLIRAEEERVLFGFWRGQRLRELDPRRKPGGKYEMATILLTEESKVSPAQVKKLVRAAMALNAELGDPTALAK